MTPKEKEIARSLLETYTHRAGYGHDHVLKLLPREVFEQFDRARCAIDKLAMGIDLQPADREALIEIVPHLAKLQRCSDCDTWLYHRSSCPQLA